MGVPAFFSWLSKKYPQVVLSCIETKAREVHGIKVTVDATQPNPNGIEFDNLYLDMNGIIHPCCHPDDKPAPKDEEEMMFAIFEYIDRIFNIVRPRRLLYMAIDGVAPRAKMNQQRSRRFRSAKDASDKFDDIRRIREELVKRGCMLPPLESSDSRFDSNCITPGTEFMARLSLCLQYYIHARMNTNPAWKGIKVILSDANAPGEGEHKIMDYIRRQRTLPDHDPNTHHCLYGADADLIMLGLATHEPHFTILREEFQYNKRRIHCDICNQDGHTIKECTGEMRVKRGKFDEMATATIGVDKPQIFIRLSVLREYLSRELRIDGLSFKYDFENVIDDWVFMCFFVGNDFLPHLPSLSIREGAIDRLVRLYKEVLPVSEGFLTKNGIVNLGRVQMIMTKLGAVEDEIFQRRREKDVSMRQRQRERAERSRIEDYKAPSFIPAGQFAPTPLGSVPSPATNARQDAYQMRQTAVTLSDNLEAAAELKRSLRVTPESSSDTGKAGEQELSRKRKRVEESSSNGQESSVPPSFSTGSVNGEDNEPEDEVRLWESGWKERYYQKKFSVSCEDVDFVWQVMESYTQGLCWVMAYYYQGCPSWKWFYPFHYAPFASDFRNIHRVNASFEKNTQPFNPLEQLMGVFPGASSKFLPLSWRALMLEEDSPIVDFYPHNFKIDLNGKKASWQGVALLPFVDERRLLRALESVRGDLDEDERKRNSRGFDRLYIHKYNKLYSFAKTLYETYPSDTGSPEELRTELNPKSSGTIRGTVWRDEQTLFVLSNNGYVESPYSSMTPVSQSQVMGMHFQDPQFPDDYEFEAGLLRGVSHPPPILKPEHIGPGRPGSYRPQIGFTQPPPRHQYGTPKPAERFIRNSLTDPRSHYRQADSSPGHGYYPSQQSPSMANWSSFPPPQAPGPSYHHTSQRGGYSASHSAHSTPQRIVSHHSYPPPPHSRSPHSSPHFPHHGGREDYYSPSPRQPSPRQPSPRQPSPNYRGQKPYGYPYY